MVFCLPVINSVSDFQTLALLCNLPLQKLYRDWKSLQIQPPSIASRKQGGIAGMESGCIYRDNDMIYFDQ